MKTGIHIPLTPMNEPIPKNLEEVYDELWDLLVANIRDLVGGKQYRNLLRAYLPDSRTDGWVEDGGVTFAFYEGEGCGLWSSLCQHWIRLGIAGLREQLDHVIGPLGYRIAVEDDVAAARSRGPRFIEIKGVPYRVAAGEDRRTVLANDVTGDVDTETLGVSTRRKVKLLIEDGECLCTMCRKLARGAAMIDVESVHRDKPPSTEFRSVSKALRYPRYAKSLALYERSLTELSDDIGRLPWLEKIYVWDNLLTTFPATIGQLTRLTELNAGNNRRLRTLPPELGQLRALTRLLLSGAERLRELPSQMRHLHRLQHLELGRSGLTEIPGWFSELEQLESLSLYAVPLQSLPTPLLELPRLCRLDIRDTAPRPFLEELDVELRSDWLAVIKALRREVGEGGGRAWLEFPFEQMPALEAVQLRGSTAIPPGLYDAAKLRRLAVYGRVNGAPLAPISEDIGRLRQLESLFVSRSDTSELPASLFTLTELRHLYIEESQISSIPDGIGALERLESLVLDGNPISEISPELQRCSQLSYLSLRGSEFKTLPAFLDKLPKLKRVRTS